MAGIFYLKIKWQEKVVALMILSTFIFLMNNIIANGAQTFHTLTSY
jgi:hypothetical protein